MQYGQYTFQNLPPFWDFRSTPGHGYLRPAWEHNTNVPTLVREPEYEEDCAYVIPVFFNKELFTEETVKQAEQTFKNWFPFEWEQIFNIELQPGESSLKDDYYFMRLNNLGKYEKQGCYGDWCFDVPKGMVYAHMVKIEPPNKKYNIRPSDGEKINVLMTEKVYQSGNAIALEDMTIYNRDETYYTWEDYTNKTGKPRYK